MLTIHVVELSAMPRTRRYLKRLPEGLDSYPEAKVKGSLFQTVANNPPAGLDVMELPDELRWLCTDTPAVNSWIPEVYMVSLINAFRDLVFDSEEALLDWGDDYCRTLFESSLYRMLFAMVSPHRLARSAVQVWASLRKGTSRELITMEDNRNVGRIRYPSHLYDGLYVEGIVRGLQVTYGMSRAPQARGRVLRHTETECDIEMVYDASLPSVVEDLPAGP